MLARKHSQSRVLRNSRVGRAGLTIEQGHFPKEIATAQFAKRHLVPILRSYADTDLPLLD